MVRDGDVASYVSTAKTIVETLLATSPFCCCGPLSASEIDVSTLNIGSDQLHSQPVSYVKSLLSLREQSLDVRLQHANKGALRGYAGDERVEHLADPVAHGNGRKALCHFAFNFPRGNDTD